MNEGENQDYTFVQVGQRQMKLTHILFIFGLVTLFLLFAYGRIGDDLDVQRVLIWVSLIAVVISVLWGLRSKLYSVVLSFIVLLVSYAVLGAVLYFAGIIPEHFSYGLVTFTIISVFMFWMSKDKKITMDDTGKIILFLIVAYVVNASGWLSQTNDIVTTVISGGLPF